MDRRDLAGMSGSQSYYMQRGMAGSGSNLHPGLQGPPQALRSITGQAAHMHSNVGGNTIGSGLQAEPSQQPMTVHGVNLGAHSIMPLAEPMKRRRGRPRKYGSDGTVSLALSPSVSANPGVVSPLVKRGRGRPPGTGRKQHLASLGEWLSGSAGMGFTPHIISIGVGEDIAAKILSFSQQGPRAVCILSGNGAVSTVTFHQPSTSGGMVTYEGRFEIVCLSGSYLLNDNTGSRNQDGGLSVSLASPEGHVIGGRVGVGGVLIAASPVQVILGSFVWGDSRTKNKRREASEGVIDSDQQSSENVARLNAPGLGPGSSPIGIWPTPHSVDMRNVHIDIDLMRG